MQFFGRLTTRKVMRTKSKVTASTWSTLEYFGHATFSIFTAAACIRLNGKTEKIRIVIVSKSKDYLRINFQPCILTAIEIVTVRYPHLDQIGSLNFGLWSDGCSVQYQPWFVFQPMMLFINELNITRYYKERYHGNGSIKGVNGCIKNVAYRAMMAENCYTHTIRSQ